MDLAGRLPWTGIWPGTAECIEFGWFSIFSPYGWERCERDAPGASPDLNRLAIEAVWDEDKRRYVRRS